MTMNVEIYSKRRLGRRGSVKSLLGPISLCAIALALSSLVAATAEASKVVDGSFGTQGTLGGQFQTPRGIAVNATGVGPADAGDIYVVDEENHRIQRFDSGGNFVSAWGADVVEEGGAGNVGDEVAAAFELCTVVADCKAGVPSGGNGAVSGNGALDTPQDIAVDGDTGNVYVSDRENARVVEYDGIGAFIRSFGFAVNATLAGEDYEVCSTADVCQSGIPGAGPGQMGSGGDVLFDVTTYGIAVSPPDGVTGAGKVYLANTANRRVEVYGLDGASPSSFGSFVFPNHPHVVAVDSRGIVYANESVANDIGVVNRYDSEDANGAGVGFLDPIATVTSVPAGPLSVGQARKVTAGLAVDSDSDGPGGADEDVLHVLRIPNTPSTPLAPSVVQQLGPENSPGLTSPPTAVDEEHGIDADLRDLNGLALDEGSGNLYVSESQGGHRIWRFVDLAVTDPPIATTGGEVTPGDEEYLRELHGVVNPNGFKVKDCHFEYGPTEEYGQTTPCNQAPTSLGSAFVDAPVSASTAPLEPDTTYHYRLVAANAAFTDFGEDRTFDSTLPPPDACGNASIRAAQGIGTLLLPDCMALEMVTPPRKGSVPVRSPKVSADGERVGYGSVGSITGEAPVYDPLQGARYVASRDVAGERWDTVATAPTAPEFHRSWRGNVASAGFSPDLSRWFTVVSTEPQSQIGTSRAYELGLGRDTVPLSPLLDPLNRGPAIISGTNNYASVVPGTQFRGASMDHSHLFFAPGRFKDGTAVAYRPGDPEPAGPEAVSNVYVAQLDADSPSLQLLARDADGKVWGGNCGTRMAGSLQESGNAVNVTARNQGAISVDGERVYFSTRADQPPGGECDATNKMRILERVETPEGPEIGELIQSECDRSAPEPCSSADGGDFFQGASVDGTKVYFTSNRQLADSDLDGDATECDESSAVAGCDLYLYDATEPTGERLIQVSAGEDVGGHETGKEARVLDSIAAVSGDGSHAYFVAEGALTGPNGEGEAPSSAAGARNLYAYKRDTTHPSGRLAFVGSLASGDEGSENGGGLWGGTGSFRNGAYPVPVAGTDGDGEETGGDGHLLVFLSEASLTADDTDGGFRDVFRYDADAEELRRISKAGASGEDNGEFDVGKRLAQNAAGPDFAQEGRWVSEDGETIVFATAEALVPGDVNRSGDYYVWRDGDLLRLPGRAVDSEVAHAALVMSPAGSTIAFATPSKLLPEDADNTKSIYVARVGGGFPRPAPPTSCEGEACQGSVRQRLDSSLPGSATTPSAGNVVRGLALPNRCIRMARKARRVSHRAKRLRRMAGRTHAPRAHGMRRRARRSARQARRINNAAKRCRASRRAARAGRRAVR